MNILKKEFIPYQEALTLKELGFDEPCFGFYKNLELKGTSVKNFQECKNSDLDAITAPVYQQAFGWFREKYKLCVIATHQSYSIWTTTPDASFIEDYPLSTYEEAELACLQKLIEIVKQTK